MAPLLGAALLLAPAVALGPVAPQALLATPPANSSCSEFGVTWPSGPVPAGLPLDVRVHVTDGAATTLRLLRRAPMPEAVLQEEAVVPPLGQPSATFTVTLTETTVLAVQAARDDGCPADDASVQQRRVEVVHPLPYDDSCRGSVRLTGDPRNRLLPDGRVVVAPNGPVHVTVTGDAPGTSWGLSAQRAGEASGPTVRTGTGATPTALTVRPSVSTLLTGTTWSPPGPCHWGAVRVAVRPALTLAARRTAPRQYAFTGRVVPGRGQTVLLRRVVPDVGLVPTAQTTVGPDGTYRIDRRFLGSGAHGFLVEVQDSATNLPGASAVRPTVVH